MSAKDHHGTYSRYTKGCRCEACRAANATYSRGRRERKKELPDFLKPAHGREARYTTYGCRCDECTAAHAAARLARYHKATS